MGDGGLGLRHISYGVQRAIQVMDMGCFFGLRYHSARWEAQQRHAMYHNDNDNMHQGEVL